jgi:glycosyltransferase involved in cell wall biosynthesis
MDENTLQPKRIVVVIPAFDAAGTLPRVLERIPPSVYESLFRILVVEDGGGKVPPSVSAELQARHPKIDILVHEHNRGYGGAQKTGFRRAMEIGADIVVLLHADGQYAPEIMEELYAPLLRDEADVVLGSRMKHYRYALRGGMPLYKFIANIGLTKMQNLAYGMKLSEYHSGYMLYSSRALKMIPFEKLGNRFPFDGEMLLMAGKKKLRIADLAIPTHYGNEKSYLNPISYGLEVMRVILKNFLGKYDF